MTSVFLMMTRTNTKNQNTWKKKSDALSALGIICLWRRIMPTKPKIKITDNTALRAEIDNLYERTGQLHLAQWSLSMAKRILKIADIDFLSVDAIAEGFKVNELWQEGKVRMYDVRQASFRVHQIARNCENEIKKAALRTAGQAIGSGHMKEHAMVASDYAIKTIGLLNANNMEAITDERLWQLEELKNTMKKREKQMYY